MPALLHDLDLPSHLPRSIVAFVSENENGALRAHARSLMAAAIPYGFDCHVIDLKDDGWLKRLAVLVHGGLLLGWGAAGVGAHLPHADGSFWDVLKIPFISVMADSPCQLPTNHNVPARYVANGYVFRDWLEVQRRLVRSAQISALVPQGVPANPHRDETPWSQRPLRMVMVKTGASPDLQRAAWANMPRRFRAVLEDTATTALRAGVGDITPLFLSCLEHHGLVLDLRPEILFGLMYRADQYIRDVRSTALVRALLPLPVDIIGRGWEHVQDGAGRAGDRRARFHAAMDAEEVPELFGKTQFVLNTMPNFAHGTHERVLNGFAARSCVITNENADMRARFGNLPTYFPVTAEAPDLTDQLATIFHATNRFDGLTDPALDLVETEFGAEAFMRGLIELSLEIRAAEGFTAFMP